MVGQPGFFDLSDRYAALSAAAIRWIVWCGCWISRCSAGR